jgi:hypothetical protein
VSLKESRAKWWAIECRRHEGKLSLEVHELRKEILAHAQRVDRMIARGRRLRLGPSAEEIREAREMDAFVRAMRSLLRSIRNYRR